MKARKSVRLPLGTRTYQIHVGPGIIKDLPKLLGKTRSKRAFLLADEALVKARKATVECLEKAGWEVFEIPLKAGESLKDIQSVYALYGELLKARATRDSTIFALGGGTIGDAVGFVAATYLRGVSWVSLPTTLLAQVDSGIGGKTGINHELGKNLIGAIYQPKLVVCDTNFLTTLSKRDIVSGLGEVVKYGIVFDAKFFGYLKKNSQKFLALDEDVLLKAILTSVQWKSKVVAKDELDLKGTREMLNFGHSFAHALESFTHFEAFRHGEAVIWGMRFALALSQIRKKLSKSVFKEVDAYLSSLEVPALPKNFGVEDFLLASKQDKKYRAGRLHFVLLKRLGKSLSDSHVSENDLALAFSLMCSQKKIKCVR